MRERGASICDNAAPSTRSGSPGDADHAPPMNAAIVATARPSERE